MSRGQVMEIWDEARLALFKAFVKNPEGIEPPQYIIDEMDDMKDKMRDMKDQLEWRRWANDVLKEENEELKEENQKLKAQLYK